MNRRVFIDKGSIFYDVNCTNVQYVYYNGSRTVSINMYGSGLVQIELNYEVAGGEKYREIAKRISKFIIEGEKNATCMEIDLTGKRNKIRLSGEEKHETKSNKNIC